MEPENTDYTPSELDAQDDNHQTTAITPPEKNPLRYGNANGNFGNDHFLLPTPPSEPMLELPSLFGGMSVRASGDFGPPPPPPPKKDSSRNTTPLNSFSRWQAPPSWDIVASSKSPSTANQSSNTSTGEDRRPNDASHFQRFVRRMEGAGPRIILERLKEEWDEPADLAMSQELHLEKHLWALTALHIRALDRFARPSDSPAPVGALPPTSVNKRRKILELDGNLGTCCLKPTIVSSTDLNFRRSLSTFCHLSSF